MNEVLVIDNLEFEIRRSARRKTFGLIVDRAGELVVHSPETAEEDELNEWLKQKLLWVHRKLLAKESYAAKVRTLDVVSGETISYLGHNYRLKIVENQSEPLRFHGDFFILRKKDTGKAPHLLQQWYQGAGTQWVEKRCKMWAKKVGITPQKIDVVNLGYRWGSCGKKGILRFHWRLFQLPVSLIDYVIVHEMAHLKERNHSPKFWQILDQVLPDWRERKQALSKRPADIHWNTVQP